MVNKNNQPHGWGRAIVMIYNDFFIDAQFKDGKYHGYMREIWNSGTCRQYEYKDDKKVRELKD